jgi:hypothetical protein
MEQELLEQQIIEKIKTPEKFNFFFLQKIEENGVKSIRKEKARYFISRDGRIGKYDRRRRRYGYPIYDLSQVVIEEKNSIKSPEKKWRDSWIKVQQRLQRSGLYQDLLINVNLALEIGYEKIKLAYTEYWKSTSDKLSYGESEKIKTERIKSIDERLLNDKGNVNTEILWHISYQAKVKKMNFGYSTNQYAFEEIKKALKDKKEISISGRRNYDVSFSYNPKINKAWYSEEFKGCGNGHYYLALDETHALFYEDD